MTKIFLARFFGFQSDNQVNSRAGFEPRSRPKGMLAPFGNPI